MIGSSAGTVVGFGELLLRFSPPDRRLIVQAQSMSIEVGGAEANVLAGLSTLGHTTAMISRVADNPLGRLARATIGARGIDTSQIAMAPGRMGLYFLEVGQGRRASAITYDRQGSAFALASNTEFDFETALRGARLLHLTGITPALGLHSAEAALAAVRTAKRLGVPISFDGNYRAQLWSAWESNPRALLAELVELTDILFGNHRDIALLTGSSFSGEGEDRRRRAVDAAFSTFPGLKIVASTARHVTDADNHILSAQVTSREDQSQTDEIAIGGIVDRIGTGDAFAAGVLHEYLQGQGCTAMARSGLALAVLKHSLPGDMPIVDRTMLEAFWTDSRDVRR